MSQSQGFECRVCNGQHMKQAFVSHSANDKEIAKKLKCACCKAGVAPFLYELSPEHRIKAPPAKVLADKIAESEILFVLLGDEVSGKYWTQAWIGFEVGIFAGLGNDPSNLKYVMAIQDIRQGIEVSVPMLNVLFLFDFTSELGWEQYEGLVASAARVSGSSEFYRVANKFRSATLKANVKCGNLKCRSEYEAWIAKRDACLLGKGLNLLVSGSEMIAECIIECPSCDQMVTRCFRQMLMS